MRNDQIIPMVTYGLKNVTNFSGRDPRIRFWPYFGFLYLLGQAVSMITIFPILQSMPVTPGAIPDANLAATLMLQINNVMLAGMITTGVMMLLLASAVTRRLHDRNMRGFWALIPAALLVCAFWTIGGMVETLITIPSADVMSDTQAMAFLNNLVPVFVTNFAYLIAVVILCIFLGLKGSPGENRFGPPVTIA